MRQGTVIGAVAVIVGVAAAIVAVALPSSRNSTVAAVTIVRAATHTTAPKHTTSPPPTQTLPSSDPSQPTPSESDHLAPCVSNRNQNEYEATPASPGCAFATSFLVSLALKVNEAPTYHAVVPVTYDGKTYMLTCYIVDQVALDCAHDGAIWVQYDYESSTLSGSPLVTPGRTSSLR